MNSNELLNRKLELLALQKEKFDQFNRCLAGQDGLNDVSRKVCKNLVAAVAASKNPGNIYYFDPPETSKKMVKGNELQKLRNVITKLQEEIDQVELEITERQKKDAAVSQPFSGNVNSLSQWFSTYGTPKPTPSGLLTTFNSNSKVYGGTNHYSAFKTQSSVMKRGRVTK